MMLRAVLPDRSQHEAVRDGWELVVRKLSNWYLELEGKCDKIADF